MPTGYDLVLGADTIVEHAMTIDLAADTVTSYGREIFLPSDTVDTDADAANLNLLTEYEYRICTTNADYTPTDILAEYEAVFRPSYGQHHAAAAPAKPKAKPMTRIYCCYPQKLAPLRARPQVEPPLALLCVSPPLPRLSDQTRRPSHPYPSSPFRSAQAPFFRRGGCKTHPLS